MKNDNSNINWNKSEGKCIPVEEHAGRNVDPWHEIEIECLEFHVCDLRRE